jgi:hypothetical protein
MFLDREAQLVDLKEDIMAVEMDSGSTEHWTFPRGLQSLSASPLQLISQISWKRRSEI